MLSNLVITNQKLVLVIDELNRERIAQKFIEQLLREQGEEVNIKTLPNGAALKYASTYNALLADISGAGGSPMYNNNNYNNNGGNNEKQPISHNIILPTLADLLSYQNPAFIFDLLNKLRKCAAVKRIFLWASIHNMQHSNIAYILAACEHLAELVLHLETPQELTIITRKPGGGVTNKRYTSTITKTQFLVSPAKDNRATLAGVTATTNATAAGGGAGVGGSDESSVKSETFKIELDEDEMVARNALKLPYEHTNEPAAGNIIYTPDAQDDFDDEDPDEDLCI